MSQLTKKERYWLNHLKAWQRSGQSIAEYTRRHKPNPSGFYEWRKRLAAHLEEGHSSERVSMFSPMAIDDGTTQGDVLVFHFPNGCRLELPCQHIELLSQVLRLADVR